VAVHVRYRPLHIFWQRLASRVGIRSVGGERDGPEGRRMRLSLLLQCNTTELADNQVLLTRHRDGYFFVVPVLELNSARIHVKTCLT